MVTIERKNPELGICINELIRIIDNSKIEYFYHNSQNQFLEIKYFTQIYQETLKLHRNY